MNKQDLIKLALVTAKADASKPVAYSYGEDKFTYDELNETLRAELNKIAGSYQLYRENKNIVFELIETTIDAVLPKRVIEQYGKFAEIKVFNQGDKPVFTQKISDYAKKRAKQFITKVGLAGVYEVFKLDGKTIEVPTVAFGGAAQIGFEEFLDGKIDFADVLELVLEGLDEAVYREIANALEGAFTSLPTGNVGSANGFDETEMDKLLSVADAYGKSTIYCTYEMAAKIVPSEGWRSGDLATERWNNGFIANYKGHNVVVLAQSYSDEENETPIMNPDYAWIIPTGSNEKPIKIAFEGQTLVDERKNADWSREIQVYKKLGVAGVFTSNICVYQDLGAVVTP